ncbi:MAG: hypothetical protein LBT19_01665 [Candidatus Nomurabacteria bacterium]|jgi:hypothetical protein|nr:hypothetical protein [Candidatus Nomurabacteria bacterium]
MNNNPIQPNPGPENQSNSGNMSPEPDYSQNYNPANQPPIVNQMPPQPQQTVSGYGTPQPNQYQPQPVVPKKPMDPKTKKLIIIICSVGGGLLILGLVALIILPIILRVDYEKTYDLGSITNDIRYDMQGSDSCGGVISYVSSSYQSKSSYEKYVSKCKSSMEEFKKSIEDLSGSSGVQRDADIKKEWDAFKTSYDSAFPAYGQLVDIYSDWHAFVAGWYETTSGSDWWDTMNETKVKNLTSSLTESNNSALKKYGDGYVSIRWKQISAYQAYKKAYNAYYDASYSDPNKTSLRNEMNAKSEAYSGIDQDYKDYIKDEPDIKDTKSLVGVDLDKSDQQFLTKFGNVYSQIYSKYLEQGFKDAVGL